MNNTMTYNEFLADFSTRWAKGEGIARGQRMGQFFLDCLHDSGRHTQANSLIYSLHDPFYMEEIHPETLAFIERVWDWPNS